MKNLQRFRITSFLLVWIMVLTTFCKEKEDLVIAKDVSGQSVTENAFKFPPFKIVVPGEMVTTPAAIDGVNTKEKIVDGSLSTRWSGLGNPQYITLDLGKRYTIAHVNIAFHTSGSATRTSNFDIAVSSDTTKEKKWEIVLANQNSAPNNVHLQTFDFDDLKGRFVRIIGHGNSQSQWNSYTEVEVWGWDKHKLPDTTTPDDGTANLVADWETGDWSQWDGGLIAKDRAAQFSVVTSPVRQGKYAAKFVVRPGDQYCKPAGGCTSGERTEVSLWNYKREALNDEYYYGWSTLFPEDWTEPYRWGIFMQWHAHTTISPPIAFNARANQVQVDFNSGNIEKWWPAEYGESFTILNDLSKGKWHDFIVRVKFRPDATGIFEVWHRLEGQAEFTKVLSLLNIPTLQWTPNINQIEAGYDVPFVKDGVNGFTTGCYIQHGLYRGNGDASTGTGQNTNTLYQDNWSRGATYNAVRERFAN
ncbi:heparin lyase I family protein [Adhaeribacter rhizoryzae]|uniref:F5/8 type C domain-containing protein n=1 Tax=Adhaeribacter rhizoryzae TaxID=2607907 RepID=A0A5M6D734_9BACT|nr:heparin lyase I family protein [Adhaeribacter rhizoryzae]KAA5543358.1 hypothetical protein F0145_17095 [Adhaeribacter rhizoryzae]